MLECCLVDTAEVLLSDLQTAIIAFFNDLLVVRSIARAKQVVFIVETWFLFEASFFIEWIEADTTSFEGASRLTGLVFSAERDVARGANHLFEDLHDSVLAVAPS